MASFENGDQRQHILTELQCYPSSFHLTLNGSNHLKRVRKVIHKVRSGKFEHPESFTDNLLSYLLWEEGSSKNVKEAEKLNKKVRTGTPKNIIGLTNYIYILVAHELFGKANIELTHLHELKQEESFGKLNTEATAELAYSYSRFGPEYHEAAIGLYKEVLEKVPNNWVWKLGYGIVMQRSLNVSSYCRVQDFQADVVYREAWNALYSIASECDDIKLKGIAWVKLALAMNGYNFYMCQNTSSDDIAWNKSEFEANRQEYYRLAYECAPDDRVVLQDCGKYYLQKHKYVLARQCLEKAKDIEANVINCSLLARLEVKEWEAEQRVSRRPHSISEARQVHHGNQQTDGDAMKMLGIDQNRKPYFLVRHVRVKAKPPLCIDEWTQDTQVFTIPKLPKVIQDPSSDTGVFRLASTATPNVIHPHPAIASNSTRPMNFVYNPHAVMRAGNLDNSKLEKALLLSKEGLALACEDSAETFRDMGIVQWRLGLLGRCHIEDALVSLRQAIKVDDSKQYLKHTCYEYIGICYQELADMEKSDDKRRELHASACAMFFRAIETAGLSKSTSPNKHQPFSVNALRNLLETDRKHADIAVRLKDRSRLHQLLGDAEKALACLDDALKIVPNDTQAMLSKAHTLIETQQFTEARLFLLSSLRNHRDTILANPTLLLKACVGAARNNLLAAQNNVKAGRRDLADEDLEEARGNFELAYKAAFSLLSLPDDVDDFEYQVCIVGNERDDLPRHYFAQVIEEYYGFKCAHDITPGNYIFDSQARALENSRNCLFALTELQLTRLDAHYVEVAVKVFAERTGTCTVTISRDEEAAMPKSLQYLKAVPIPGYSSWKETLGDDIENIIQLFKAIINSDELEK